MQSDTLPKSRDQLIASQQIRYTNIELIRIVAAFGVILIHTHNNTAASALLANLFLLFCVPFFFIVSLVFSVPKPGKSVSVKAFLIKSWWRIGLPFLVWSSIYAGLIFVRHLLRGEPYEIDPVGLFFYGQSAEHLYYLPQLITMQALILGSFLLITKKQTQAGFLLLGAVAYLVLGNWRNYFGVTPTATIAVYLAAAYLIASKIKQKNIGLLLGGLALIALAISQLWIDYPVVIHPLISPLGGIGLLLVALQLADVSSSGWLITLSSTTYGVYLSHVAFLEALEFIVERAHIKLFYDLKTQLMVAIFVFVVSVLFVLVVRRIKLAKLLLLGEQ
ncbi:acyltransferase family protein [Tellurirhabdus bombi]|uniref:acyltransferase family protein n=1 Tax=Tellurirhabdus bombi TaxID=2907205 RepID=UPI001F2835DE|nr:acyltransferase [Tellurirhabdus bombi]